MFPLNNQLVSRIEELRAGRDANFRAYFRASGFAQVLQGHVNIHGAAKLSSPVLEDKVLMDTAAVPFHVGRLHLIDRSGTTKPIVVAKSKWA